MKQHFENVAIPNCYIEVLQMCWILINRKSPRTCTCAPKALKSCPFYWSLVRPSIACCAKMFEFSNIPVELKTFCKNNLFWWPNDNEASVFFTKGGREFVIIEVVFSFQELDLNRILPLAEFYQMDEIIQRCDNFLFWKPPSVTSLVIAEKFDLWRFVSMMNLGMLC